MRKTKEKRDYVGIQMDSPIGTLSVAEDGAGICDVYLGALEGLNDTISDVREQETPLLAEARRQLTEYFAGTRREFSLPLSLHGTEFQIKDWKALQEIPYGETCSYKQIAERIGSPKAFRAVGMANNKNRIAIIIPCHRVIGADGSLVGYGGGIDKKIWLLELEKRMLH